MPRRRPRSGWSSSPNQWKTPQSTTPNRFDRSSGGNGGCAVVAVVGIGAAAGFVSAVAFLAQCVV